VFENGQLIDNLSLLNNRVENTSNKFPEVFPQSRARTVNRQRQSHSQTILLGYSTKKTIMGGKKNLKALLEKQKKKKTGQNTTSAA